MTSFINWLKIYLIALLLLVIPLSSSAETGSIVIENSSTFTTYNWGETGTLDTTAIWTKIIWDTADFNYISSFRVTGYGGTYTLEFVNSFESTTFDITSGGTGNGWAWYDRNTSSVYYSFDSSSVFTSSPLILSFDTDIFSNVSMTSDGYARDFGGGGISVTKPVCLGLSSNTICACRFLYNNVQVSTRATDYYNVSYLPNELFMISINKNIYIDTKYFINTYDGFNNYSSETTFNKVDINNAIFTYERGLSLNATLNNGVYEIAYINSTGCDNCTGYTSSPIEYPDPNNSGGGSGYLVYNSSSLYSDTTTIHNNSDIWIKYDLRFVVNETLYDQFGGTVGGKIPTEKFNWFVVLKNPDLTLASSKYSLDILCTKTPQSTLQWLGLLDDEYACESQKLIGESYVSSHAFYIDAPGTNWTNQTYTAYLYEDFSGNQESLHSISWNVLNTTGYFGGNSANIAGGGTGQPSQVIIPSGDGNSIMSTIINFMALPIFWGLVFICVVIYYLKNTPNLILPILFVLINVEAVVGLLDPYATYLVILTWLIIAINFIFVQRKTTG